MEWAAVHATTCRSPDYNGHRSAATVMRLGGEVRYLIKGTSYKIDKLHLRYGTQSEIAHADSRTNDCRFADRRIDDALPTKPLQQARCNFECTAVHADVLADQHHGRVAIHLFKKR